MDGVHKFSVLRLTHICVRSLHSTTCSPRCTTADPYCCPLNHKGTANKLKHCGLYIWPVTCSLRCREAWEAPQAPPHLMSSRFPLEEEAGALNIIQRESIKGAKKEQREHDKDNICHLPDRAKERRQRNAKADFIVASATQLCYFWAVEPWIPRVKLMTLELLRSQYIPWEISVLLYFGSPAGFITGYYEDLNLVKVHNRIIWTLYNNYMRILRSLSLWLDCNGTKERLKKILWGKWD